MNQEEFEIFKEQTVKAADQTIAMAFEIGDPKIAHAYIQLLGVRLLATVLGSKMFNDKASFESVAEPLLNGLRKESHLVFEETARGERDAVNLDSMGESRDSAEGGG